VLVIYFVMAYTITLGMKVSAECRCCTHAE